MNFKNAMLMEKPNCRRMHTYSMIAFIESQRYKKLNHMFLSIQTHIVFQTHKVVLKNAEW